MNELFHILHASAAGALFGKVLLLSFVVAPILAKHLEAEAFSRVVRQLFPAYYAMGIGAAIAGLISMSGLLAIHGFSVPLVLTGGIWLVILAVESYCRSPLTPRSNMMRDRLKEQERQGGVDPRLQDSWNRLHQRSVYLNSLVLLAGFCLVVLGR
ncbi:DUF4149 domain-containing protein [Petrachloros mirabilis]